MWNAGIPYILKQFIDVVSQPGMVFSFDPELGYTGLVTGRKAAVVYTSAVYGPGRPPSFGSDFQAPYLRDWLNWAGIADVTEIAFRPNLATADAETGRQAAHAAAGMPPRPSDGRATPTGDGRPPSRRRAGVRSTVTGVRRPNRGSRRTGRPGSTRRRPRRRTAVTASSAPGPA